MRNLNKNIFDGLSPKFMRRPLTMLHILASPLVVLLSVAMVFAWGAVFDPAHAATLSEGFGGWFTHNLAPIMFVSMVFFLLLGYPTAFTLAGVGLLYFLVGMMMHEFKPDFFLTSNERIWGTMKNEILLAIPFFTFMGLILQRSGMAEDLLDTVGQLFGPIRGGLAYAVIFVGALLGATTGVVAASVIAMGLISLPIMMRYGYNRQLTAGVITSAGTLAQIVPPSLVLIIMADQLGRSVEHMYVAALYPAIIIPLMYAAWVFIVSMFDKNAAPGLPLDAISYREDNGSRGLWSLLALVIFAGFAAYFSAQKFGASILNQMRDIPVETLAGKDAVVVYLLFGMMILFLAALLNRIVKATTQKALISKMAEATAFVLVPPLLLIFLVLGTIMIGLATPTEGGAMGALGALILAAIKRVINNDPARFSYVILRDAIYHTAKLSAFVMFILLGARVFSLTFFGVSGHHWVEEILLSVTGNPIGFLLLISAIIFVLGMFLDFFEIAFIAVPLLIPAAETLGIDLIWLGIILSINLQTSFLTPPFGFALFYFRSTAPRESYTDRVTGQTIEPIHTSEIYKGVFPFIIIQIVMILMVIFMPQLVMHYKGKEVLLDDESVNQELNSFGDDLGIGEIKLDF